MPDAFEDHCWKDAEFPRGCLRCTRTTARALRRSGAGAACDSTRRRARLPGRREAQCRAHISELVRRARLGRDRADATAVRRGPRRGHPGVLLDARRAARQRPARRRRDEASRHAGRSRGLRDTCRVRAAAGPRSDHQAARERVLRHAARRAPDVSSACVTLVVCGESTSGCVRATGGRPPSHGFQTRAGRGMLLPTAAPPAQDQPVRPAPQVAPTRCTWTRSQPLAGVVAKLTRTRRGEQR